MLAEIYPDCPIFLRNYQGENYSQYEPREIDNSDKFFSNLPTLESKSLKKRNTILNKMAPVQTKLEKL